MSDFENNEFAQRYKKNLENRRNGYDERDKKESNLPVKAAAVLAGIALLGGGAYIASEKAPGNTVEYPNVTPSAVESTTTPPGVDAETVDENAASTSETAEPSSNDTFKG